MKAVFFITLSVFASVAWARPTEDEEADASQAIDSLMVLEAIAQLNELEPKANPGVEIMAIFMVLIGSVPQLESSFEQGQKEVCARKYGIKEEGENDPHAEGCAIECIAEQAGMWKDGEPDGFLKAWKQFGDLIMEKYRDIDENITEFAEAAQRCIKPAPLCLGFSQTTQCLKPTWDKLDL